MRRFGDRGLSSWMATGALAVVLACAGCAGSVGNNATANTGGEGASSVANVEAANEGAASNVSNDASSTAGSTNANAAAAPIVDGDAEDAQGVLPNGWYQASLTASSDVSSPAVTSVTVDGDTWTLVGSMARADAEDALGSSEQRVGPNTWVLKVADGAVFESGGGDAENQAVDRATFEDVMGRLNGLGLVLHVEDGAVTYARLAS